MSRDPNALVLEVTLFPVAGKMISKRHAIDMASMQEATSTLPPHPSNMPPDLSVEERQAVILAYRKAVDARLRVAQMVASHVHDGLMTWLMKQGDLRNGGDDEATR